MRVSPLAILMLLCGLPASAAQSCPPSPEFRQAEEQCRRDPSPAACAWIAAAVAAATHAPHPEKHLEARFGLPADAASKLLLAILLLTDNSLDPRCKDRVVSPQMRRLLDSKILDGDGMSPVFYVLYLNDAVLGPRLAATLSEIHPSLRPGLRATALGFEEALLLLGKEDLPSSLRGSIGGDVSSKSGGLWNEAGGCPPLAEFRPVVEQCRLDGRPDFCGWVEAVRDLGRPGSRPETILARRFGLPDAAAERLLPVLGLLAADSTEPACSESFLLPRAGEIVDRQVWEKVDRQAAVAFVLMYGDPRFAGFVAEIEGDIEPSIRPGLVRAAQARSEFLRRSGRADLLDRIWNRAGGHFEAEGRRLWQGPEDTFSEDDMKELEVALEEFSRGFPARGRTRLDRLCSSSEPRVAVRVGYLLSRRGFLEDAERYLRDGQERLFPGLVENPENLYLSVLALWARIRLLSEMGLGSEAAALETLLAEFDDPVATALLEALAAPQGEFLREPVKAGLDWEALLKAQELARRAGTLQEFIRAYRTVAPIESAGGNGRKVDDSRLLLISRILAELQKKDLGAAEELAEKYLELVPRYEGLDVLTRIARTFIERGRNGDALRVARRIVDLVEKRLEPYQLEETLRSFIDSQVYGAYAFAVDVAAGSARAAEAFELAERGRTFTLRRRLGADRHFLSSGATAREKVIEASIAERGRGSHAPREELVGLYREFERLRFDRNLKTVSLEAGQSPHPAATAADLQRSLLPGEMLLAYHEILGPPAIPPSRPRYFPDPQDYRLWIWLVPAQGEVVQVRGLLARKDRERFHCLAQAMRWQNVASPARRAAAARGVEILESCPGAGTGEEPAAELYRMLIAPVEKQLRAGKRLIVVPHQQLHGLPFAALRHPVTGRRLAEDFEVSVAPSAGVLRQLRSRDRLRGEARRGDRR